MATLLTLLDDLRDQLNDSGDTKWSKAMKVRYINRGQNAMYPKVFRILQDATLVWIVDTYEYIIPTALDEGTILGVEAETEDDTSDFVQLGGQEFDIVPNASFGNTLVLKRNNLPTEAGSTIRFTAAMPLTVLVNDGDTWSGPAITEAVPVLYAMGLAMARDLEARLNYYRFSTTQALNGTVLEDFSGTSQFWFDQFNRELDQFKMPMPNP
jgi:hypothetical protein